LGWERRSLAAIEVRAPSTAFAHSGTTAHPRLEAFLDTIPVIRLGIRVRYRFFGNFNITFSIRVFDFFRIFSFIVFGIFSIRTE
jgi:hypothetical protein